MLRRLLLTGLLALGACRTTAPAPDHSTATGPTTSHQSVVVTPPDPGATPPASPELPAAAAHIDRALRARVPAMTQCYEAALEKDPELGGGVLVVVDVDASGAVTARLAEGPASEPVRRCVEGVLASLPGEVEPPPEPLTLEVPLRFRSVVVPEPETPPAP